MSSTVLREFCEADAREINRLAVTAFEEFGCNYSDQAWPVIRSLVVDPKNRGAGVGRALTQECIKRARRDRSPVIALHTSAIMKVALAMYLRMGFEWHHDAPAVYGVPYAVYLKKLLP